MDCRFVLTALVALNLAMSGCAGTDSYLEEWKRGEPRDCGDDLQAEADAEAARLEALYDDAALEQLIRAKGLATPDSGAP